MAKATLTLSSFLTKPQDPTPRVVTVREGWGYWDLTHYPSGGCLRRSTEDTTLAVDTEHAGELHCRLPDGRRICIQARAAVQP